jgi:hypothetical protein
VDTTCYSRGNNWRVLWLTLMYNKEQIERKGPFTTWWNVQDGLRAYARIRDWIGESGHFTFLSQRKNTSLLVRQEVI